MDSFSVLEGDLDDCLANSVNDEDQLANLHRSLERARPRFLSLLDIPPKSQSQRTPLEKDKRKLARLEG